MDWQAGQQATCHGALETDVKQQVTMQKANFKDKCRGEPGNSKGQDLWGGERMMEMDLGTGGPHSPTYPRSTPKMICVQG